MILVTGADGFVGRPLCRTLERAGEPVRRAIRHPPAEGSDHAEDAANRFVVGDIAEHPPWRPALEGAEVVIHLAARVHVMRDAAKDPLAAFRRVNVDGAVQLATEAARAGVRRLIYLSTAKVNGEATAPHAPFDESQPPAPEDPYALSKWEGEQAVRAAAASRMEVVIIRPPLVYGPRVRGNILRLLRWIDRGLWLPLGRVDNRRSLVGLDNLISALVVCARHPAAAGETFLLSDGHDLSTPELIRRLARGLGRPARLLPIPVGLLRAAGRLLGRRALVERLCGSLTIDPGKARQVLGWQPVQTVEEGLGATGQWYRCNARSAR